MEGITKTLLPSAGWNIDKNGGIIPKQVPNGSEFVSKSGKNYTYKTPDGETLTINEISLRSMYGNFNTASRLGEVNYKYTNESGEEVNADGTPLNSQVSAQTSSDTQTATSSATGSTYTGEAQANIDNTTNVPDAVNPTIDDSVLRGSDEFKSLSADQQEAVLSVYQAIAANNEESAQKLAAAFKTAAGISDPFFKQELRLASDALERGFVAIDQEEEYKVKQLRQNQIDLEQDLQTQKDYLSFEEQSALKQIERQYGEDLKKVRQNAAATGKTFSSERADTEMLVEEATGDLRESTTRRFGAQQQELARTSERSARDTQTELDRLAELTQQKRVDLFREGEAQVGTKNLPTLSGTEGIASLGDIVGDIPQRQTADIISGAQNLIF